MDKKEYNIGIKIGSESRILILFLFWRIIWSVLYTGLEGLSSGSGKNVGASV